MSEAARPALGELSYAQKHPGEMSQADQRLWQEIAKRQLMYMTEAQLRQARYLLSDARKPS